MAKRRELPETAVAGAPSKGGVSALRIVLVGAVVAFGGYSAVAGASLMFGRSPDGAVPPAAAKAEIDCASSRFAWRPECRRTENAEVAASDDDKARRTRRRSTAGPAVEPVASPTIAQLAEAALAEPVEASATETRPDAASTAAPAIGRRLAKRTEPAPAVEPAAPAVARAAREPSRAVAAATRRERRAESLRVDAARETPDADDAASAGKAKAKLASREKRLAARATVRKLARRDAAQFASLPRERVGRARRTRSMEPAWEPAQEAGGPVVDNGWRSRRDLRLARRDRGSDSFALPAGMTASTVRTYELPDGRLVSVRVKPRPEEVQALLAYHRANTARTASFFPW